MNTNDTQWIMQLTQAIYAAQQSTASRPVKDTAQDKEKSDFQNLLENKKAEGNQQSPSEAPAENGGEQMEQEAAVQGAAAQVLLPFFQQMPVMQTQIQGEGTQMPMAEVLPVGAEILQGAEMTQLVQQGAGQVLAGEEMPILETQGEEMAQAQPVLSQTDGTAEQQPVEMVSTQETVEAPKQAENNGALFQNGAGDTKPEDEVVLQAQTGSVEQPLFQETQQMPQKVGQPETLDLESPDVENQLNTRITQALEQDIQKMELQLEPEGLGKLVIQMEKSPEGALHVVLQASNETALQMLKDHSGSLGLMLQNSQAAPVRLEVQRQDNPEQNPWNQQEQNQNQNHSQQQQQQRRQENRQSEDFLQKLRLGLMPA